ncbi:acyltransferase [Dyadobacter sp. CY347]|uniref:acyltransferase family protein n=1 Tax=Dyadobacter sp. CY347 TaxID=2909336 RepID=UPI001F280094|nr:acyltransferase [Dyadobacter sp. CY347]MCF2487383.1 acyltransferase [Dyadobacter sp. CY347]
MQKHQAFLAYGRGFAITTIVCFHFLQAMNLPGLMASAINLGGAGVHFFFFASGYGLMNSRYNGVANFFKARFNRVVKPYYFIITAIFLLNIPLNLYNDGWESYLSHILFYKMFTSDISSFGGHFWYISTLLQFYLIFPVLRHLVDKTKPETAILVSTLISLMYSGWVVYIGQTETRQLNSFFLQFLWEFVLGMVICKTNFLERLISKSLMFYIIITVVTIAITGLLVTYFGSIGKMYNDFFSFVGYLGICIICYRIRLFSNTLYYLDSISLPLYLTHVFVISLYISRIAADNQIRYLDLPILLLFSLLVAVGVNYLTSHKTVKTVTLAKSSQDA